MDTGIDFYIGFVVPDERSPLRESKMTPEATALHPPGHTDFLSFEFFKRDVSLAIMPTVHSGVEVDIGLRVPYEAVGGNLRYWKMMEQVLVPDTSPDHATDDSWRLRITLGGDFVPSSSFPALMVFTEALLALGWTLKELDAYRSYCEWWQSREAERLIESLEEVDHATGDH